MIGRKMPPATLNPCSSPMPPSPSPQTFAQAMPYTMGREAWRGCFISSSVMDCGAVGMAGNLSEL